MARKRTSTVALEYDYVVIGSGFGGAVSALRLTEKGYRVLLLEKGKRFAAHEFAKTNWDLRRWLWLPLMRFFGIFRISIFRHATILSGVGYGGGSLVYANTLPVPKKEFFTADSWSHLADWHSELSEFYETARRMLGATLNPHLQIGDTTLQQLARRMGRESEFEATNVAIFFGEAEKTVPDPYFGGEGPDRAGCTLCGGCMVGCRYNAKNTLDKNYLYFAEKRGVKVQVESEVTSVVPLGSPDGADGYSVAWRSSTSFLHRPHGSVTTRGIVFAGGVMGTVKLFLQLQRTTLPRLSRKVGDGVRTNSESLLGVTALDKETNFSKGIAIGSILHTDDNSHLEPVRYPSGSGFWRVLASPKVFASNLLVRLGKVVADIVRHPVLNFRAYFVDDWAKRTQILLFMQTIDTHLRFSEGWFRLRTTVERGTDPTAFIPAAHALADEFAALVNGKPVALLTETILGIPTTAHILGGCVMGTTAEEGVIDKDNRVLGYENMYVCDGSAISANPGVNPSLTITALTERAMSKIPHKH